MVYRGVIKRVDPKISHNKDNFVFLLFLYEMMYINWIFLVIIT